MPRNVTVIVEDSFKRFREVYFFTYTDIHHELLLMRYDAQRRASQHDSWEVDDCWDRMKHSETTCQPPVLSHSVSTEAIRLFAADLKVSL
jgi:hypothetical protein